MKCPENYSYAFGSILNPEMPLPLVFIAQLSVEERSPHKSSKITAAFWTAGKLADDGKT